MRLVQVHEERLLFNQISEGNELAFRKIYDAYFDRLVAYILKMLKCQDTAEEVVQDIFLKLWHDRASLKDIEAPQAYIFSITRNKTIVHLRRFVKEMDIIAVLAKNLKHNTNEAELRIDVEELQMLITKSIAKLSPQKQRIFQMSKYEGFSHDEISETLKVSKSTVKNHLSETLQYLRKNLQGSPKALLLLGLIEWLKSRP